MALIPFDNLTSPQRDALQRVVRGRVVHDLGSGDLTYAHDLVHLGAERVIAIDKEPYEGGVMDARVTFRRTTFSLVADNIDVAFMSWPSNYNNRIEIPASRAKTLVYIGKNTDHTVCGSSQLFELLLRRKLVAYIPAPRNVLLICEGKLDAPRLPTPDEYAGIHLERVFMYEEAEALRGVVAV